MSTCECCGHAVSGDQRGLCACCERTLPGIGLLPDDILPHVLIRAAGGSMKDAAKATGTRPYDSDYALTKAQKALGCRRDYLLTVARYGLANHRLNVPAGFERPNHATPTHDTPAPRTQPRPEIPKPPESPVEVQVGEASERRLRSFTPDTPVIVPVEVQGDRELLLDVAIMYCEETQPTYCLIHRRQSVLPLRAKEGASDRVRIVYPVQ